MPSEKSVKATDPGRPPSELQSNMKMDEVIRDNARLTEELAEARTLRDGWEAKALHLEKIHKDIQKQLDSSFLISLKLTPSLWFLVGGGVPRYSDYEEDPEISMIRVDEFAAATMEELGAPEPSAVRQREILRGLLKAGLEQIDLSVQREALFHPATKSPNGEPPR